MGNGVSGSGHGLSNGRSCSNEHSASPTQVRHNTANGRKGDQDEQALSEEDNTPKRRQADDTKTKLKRRQQPKIAAAYR